VNRRATATVERAVTAVEHAGEGEAVVGRRRAHFDGDPHETVVYDRRALAPEAAVDGPAVLEQKESTTLLPPGWRGTVRRDGTVVLERGEHR